MGYKVEAVILNLFRQSEGVIKQTIFLFTSARFNLSGKKLERKKQTKMGAKIECNNDNSN